MQACCRSKNTGGRWPTHLPTPIPATPIPVPHSSRSYRDEWVHPNHPYQGPARHSLRQVRRLCNFHQPLPNHLTSLIYIPCVEIDLIVHGPEILNTGSMISRHPQPLKSPGKQQRILATTQYLSREILCQPCRSPVWVDFLQPRLRHKSCAELICFIARGMDESSSTTCHRSIDTRVQSLDSQPRIVLRMDRT